MSETAANVAPHELMALANEVKNSGCDRWQWNEFFKNAMTHLDHVAAERNPVTNVYEPKDPKTAEILAEAELEAARRRAAACLAAMAVDAIEFYDHVRVFDPTCNPLTFLEKVLSDDFEEWADHTEYMSDLRSELDELKACC